jgi:hypothetical protein
MFSTLRAILLRTTLQTILIVNVKKRIGDGGTPLQNVMWM